MKTLPLKRYVSGVVISMTLWFSANVHAELKLVVEEPDWQVLLRKPERGGERDDHISREESRFLLTVREDLTAGRYDVAAKAFAEQDMTEASTAFRELYGQILVNLKRFDDAEKVLTQVIADAPDFAAAHRTLSVAYLMQSQFKNARESLIHCASLGLQDDQIYGQLGYANLQEGYPVSAISAYQNALMLAPENTQWARGLLYALVEADAFDQASALLEEMLQDNSDDADLWIQRGRIALRQDQNVKALASVETALALGQDNLDNLITAARLHAAHGSAARATALIEDNMSRFLSADDEDAFNALLTVARYLEYKGDWSHLDALTTSATGSKVRLSSERKAKLLTLQAKVAASRDRTTKAIQLLTEAVKLAPAEGEGLLTLANLYEKTKKYERATVYYLRAAALPDYKERAQLGQAQVAVNQQRYDDALTLLRTVYRSNPARTDLLGNIQSLEKILQNTI